MTRVRASAAALAVAVVVFVLVWFQPQKLFIDDRVDETLPAVARGAPADLARGTFVSRDHGTSGRVRILDVGGGARVLRIEDLDTSNGPDLYVYLSTNAAAGEEDRFDDDYLDLGRLHGNLGDQNYDIPTGVDLSRFRSVVVWCDRFDSAFGAAELEVA